MPPSTGFGEVIGAGVGFFIPMAGTFLVAYFVLPHVRLEVLFVIGIALAFAGMMAGMIFGNFAADRWNKHNAKNSDHSD